MQVQRTLHQIFIIALLLFGSGCTSAAQSNQTNTEFSEAELDQMLAPVALYPDSVLTHVLIAATYPLEVVQAARWLEQNPGLSSGRCGQRTRLGPQCAGVSRLSPITQTLK